MVKSLNELRLAVHLGHFVPCSDIHPHSCSVYAASKFVSCFRMGLMFYGAVHLIPLIAMKSEKAVKKPRGVFRRYITDVITSSLFIASYVALFWYFLCKSKNYRRKIDKWNIIIASLLSTLSIFFEPAHRRTELGLYLFPRFLEQVYLYLKRGGYISPIDNSECVIVAISIAIIMMSYKSDGKVNSIYLDLLKKFLGEY